MKITPYIHTHTHIVTEQFCVGRNMYGNNKSPNQCSDHISS